MVTIQEKAIEQLERISRNLATIGEKEDYTDIAIKALDQEHCEDAVSRKTVLNTLNRMDSVLDEDRTVETYKELLTACYNDLPPVTPAHKTGKWIYSGSYDEDGMLFCSNCKHEIDVSEWYFKFCPNCGAKMEVEDL